MILYLSPGIFDKGGISRYGRFQLRALRDLFGERVIVLSLLGPAPNSFEDPIQVDWHGDSRLDIINRFCFSLQACRKAFTQRPRAILCGHVYLAPLGILLGRMLSIPLIVDIYGFEVWSGLGAIRRAALRRAALVIADCHNTADVALSLGLVAQRPVVVWDCVDLERYRPGPPEPTALARYGIERGPRFRILFLSRLTEHAVYKGLRRAMELLSALGPDYELVVAGGGDSREAFQQEAAASGLGEQVHFTGSVAEADMPSIYRSADAFYLVSEVGPGKGEGIPLTPLEAIACGVPVLVGNQDGSREILTDRGGLCSEPTAIDRQKDYLQRLAQDRNYFHAEQQAAAARAIEAFGYPRFVAETQAAVAQLGLSGTSVRQAIQ